MCLDGSARLGARAKRRRQWLCCLGLCFAILGCHAPAPVAAPLPTPPACSLGLREYRRTELYFGLLRAGGKLIEPTTFDAFAESYIAPSIPSGFTLVQAEGRYHAGEHDVREPSRVLIVLHRGEPEVLDAIERVRAQFKTLFAQASVLRADSRVCVSF